MKTTLLTGISVLLWLLNAGALYGQSPTANNTAETTVVTFRFLPAQDMFYIPWADNGVQLDKLFSLVEAYRTDIAAGRMPVYVDGYCASGESPEASFRIAVDRSNRVKSALITGKGLAEHHFVTKNHATAYTTPGGGNLPRYGGGDAPPPRQGRGGCRLRGTTTPQSSRAGTTGPGGA